MVGGYPGEPDRGLMRTTSDKWKANQAAIASEPARLNAFIETRGPEEAIRQTAATAFVTHPGGTAVIGQMHTISEPLDITAYGTTLSLTGWTTGSLSLEIWSVNPSTGQLIALVETGTSLPAITEDFYKRETLFFVGDVSTWPHMKATKIAAGSYAFLILAPPTGTLDVWYAVGNRYEAGNRVACDTHVAGSLLSETADEDLMFAFYGNVSSVKPVWRWHASNDPAINNAIEASIISVFDPTGATLPIESCSVTIQNGLE